MNKIGEFEVESGKVMVSDPCYDFGTWCATELPAANGEWEAYITRKKDGDWGVRVWTLKAVLKGHNTQGSIWEEGGIGLGVDSGQMSIYDYKHYRNYKDIPKGFKFKRTADWAKEDDANEWYKMICEGTLAKDYTVTKYGCASSSGIGDGQYPLEVQYRDGKAVAIKVKFL